MQNYDSQDFENRFLTQIIYGKAKGTPPPEEAGGDRALGAWFMPRSAHLLGSVDST